MTQPARLILMVTTLPTRKGWFVVHGDMVLGFDAQYWAIARARDLALHHTASGGKAQVKVRGRNGRWRTEYTYPRSSDPKRSPG